MRYSLNKIYFLLVMKSAKNALFFSLLTFMSHFLWAQAELVGNDAPANFSWGAPGGNDVSFRILSLDNSGRTFYVNKGDFFAPITTSTRSIGALYFVPKGKEIRFYRRIEDAALGKGRARYVQDLSVSTGGSSDILIGCYARGGSLSAAAVDISLDKMPIGTFSAVNLSPTPVGIAFGKKAIKLNTFSSTTAQPDSQARGMFVQSFDLKDSKTPRLVSESRYSFGQNERAMLIFFMSPQADDPNRPVRAAPTHADSLVERSASVPTSNLPMIYLTNRGPR